MNLTYRWDYYSTGGELLGYVLRFDPAQGKKQIVPYFTPDDNGGFIKGIPVQYAGKRPLFGLNSLQGPDIPIFITEGEKCAAALHGLGLQAVCSISGAENPHHADWQPIANFSGVIYLLLDNDTAGEHYGRGVWLKLKAAGISADLVRVVRFSSMAPAADVVDWLSTCLPLETRWNGFDPLGKVLPDSASAIQADLLAYCQQRGEALLPEWDNPTPATTATVATVGDEPIPLRPSPLSPTPFPVKALGPFLEPVAHAIADIANVDIAMCGQSVLAANTLAVQGLANVRFPNGQEKPLSGFFLTVATSGDGKTSCDQEALKPVRERQNELAEQRRGLLKDWKAAHDSWENRRKQIMHKPKGSMEAELHQIGPEPEKPLFPMLVCEEPTIEGLFRVLNEGQASQGIFTDEGGQFIGGHGMSDDSRLRTISNLSAFWDGREINRVRQGTEYYMLRGKRLSLHLMMQPIIASQVLSHPLLREQGFLARCLTAFPPTRAGKRLYRKPEKASHDMVHGYVAHMLEVLRKPQPLRVGSRNELQPRQIGLSASLEDRWIAFQHETEHARGPDGVWAPISAFAAKLPEHALRLAGVLTLAGEPDATMVAADALEGAIELARYYAAEALRIEQEGIASPEIRCAEKLLAWLQNTWEFPHISVADICRRGPYSLRAKRDAKQAITTLVSHHWLVLEDGPVSIDGNTRREAWRIIKQSQESQLSQGG